VIQAPAILRQPVAAQRLPAPAARPAAESASRLPVPSGHVRGNVPMAPRAAACPNPVSTPLQGAAAPVEPVADGRGAGVAGSMSRRRRRPRTLAFVIPLFFLLTCSGLFFGAIYLLRPQEITAKPDVVPRSSIGQSARSGLWPVEIESKLPHDPAREPEQSSPAPSAPMAEPSLATDTAAGAIAAGVPPAHWASEVLDLFLTANSLDERLPLLLTNRTPQELAATSLAGPLPQPAIPSLERQIHTPGELLMEFFFRVSFPDAPEPHPTTVTVLVRQRGDAEAPKIVVDPFLDLFDGSLTEFGAAPLDGSRTFHVLAEPIPICDSIAVPEADKKITLRLRPHETAKELANAYVNKRSSIGEMLDQPRSSLRWGQAVPCVVTLHWNHDIPGKPFLELVRLDAVTWNR
jgi:hypothetical protein